MQRTMLWRFEGRLGVIVHGPQSPSNLEWQSFLKDTSEHGAGTQGRIIVVSHGGGPDGEQRKRLAQAVQAAPSPVVIMTKSVLVRGITGALSYFNRNTKSAGLHDDQLAYEFLGLGAEERIRAQKLRAELEAELGLR